MMASFACITEIHVVHIFHGGYLDYRGDLKILDKEA